MLQNIYGCFTTFMCRNSSTRCRRIEALDRALATAALAAANRATGDDFLKLFGQCPKRIYRIGQALRWQRAFHSGQFRPHCGWHGHLFEKKVKFEKEQRER